MKEYELAKLVDFILFNLKEGKNKCKWYNEILEKLEKARKENNLDDKKKYSKYLVDFHQMIEKILIDYHLKDDISKLLNDDKELDKFLSSIREEVD